MKEINELHQVTNIKWPIIISKLDPLTFILNLFITIYILLKITQISNY